jgi:hypothetical protein
MASREGASELQASGRWVGSRPSGVFITRGRARRMLFHQRGGCDGTSRASHGTATRPGFCFSSFATNQRHTKERMQLTGVDADGSRLERDGDQGRAVGGALAVGGVARPRQRRRGGGARARRADLVGEVHRHVDDARRRGGGEEEEEFVCFFPRGGRTTTDNQDSLSQSRASSSASRSRSLSLQPGGGGECRRRGYSLPFGYTTLRV